MHRVYVASFVQEKGGRPAASSAPSSSYPNIYDKGKSVRLSNLFLFGRQAEAILRVLRFQKYATSSQHRGTFQHIVKLLTQNRPQAAVHQDALARVLSLLSVSSLHYTRTHPHPVHPLRVLRICSHAAHVHVLFLIVHAPPWHVQFIRWYVGRMSVFTWSRHMRTCVSPVLFFDA